MKNSTGLHLVVATLILLTTYVQCVQAEDLLDKYTSAVWKNSAGESFNYRYRSPASVEEGEKYPLLLFLHGAGGRGNDNQGELTDAGTIQALEKAGVSGRFNSYVIAGQVPKDKLWVDVDWTTKSHKMPPISKSMELMFETLDAFVANPENQIDQDRIYVMGLSMGGYGTWDAIQRRPDFFAAAVPICGGADNRLASSFADLPIWAWHGDKDGGR